MQADPVRLEASFLPYSGSSAADSAGWYCSAKGCAATCRPMIHIADPVKVYEAGPRTTRAEEFDATPLPFPGRPEIIFLSIMGEIRNTRLARGVPFLFGGTGANMAETAVLKVSKRDGRGSRKAGELRKSGQTPAVIYGHKQETISVAGSGDELASAIRPGARVGDLGGPGGGTEEAQIMEVQWDHLGQDILHADFRRVAEDERIHVAVRIELRGIAPGVTAGGVLDQPLHTVE